MLVVAVFPLGLTFLLGEVDVVRFLVEEFGLDLEVDFCYVFFPLCFK